VWDCGRGGEHERGKHLRDFFGRHFQGPPVNSAP
jgi:hypothetical protein